MESVNVAVLGGEGARELASQIGKKGSETDVTQYNLKQGDRSLTLFAPAKFPDKIQGVSYSLQAADHVLLVVDAIDRHLGEQIVAADMAGKQHGFLILRNYIQPDQIQPLLAGTNLEGYELLESDDAGLLRERFIDLTPARNEGETRVDVDQHFNVKGVGTVVLGVVTRGQVAKHQELQVFPKGKKCQVRSIQVHDTDVDTADTGSRVGLAVKNIDSDDLDRGDVLAPEGSLRAIKKGDTFDAHVSVPKFFKDGLKEDQVLHLGVGMQFMPVRIRSIEGGSLGAGAQGAATFLAESSLVLDGGDRALLFHLDNANLRVAGGLTTT